MLLVYPDNLTMDELVKVCQKLKDKLKEHKSSIRKDIISQVALKIRDDIRNQDITQAWPPHVSDLQMMNSTPTSLVEFLQTLLTGSSKVGNNPSQKAHSFIQLRPSLCCYLRQSQTYKTYCVALCRQVTHWKCGTDKDTE